MSVSDVLGFRTGSIRGVGSYNPTYGPRIVGHLYNDVNFIIQFYWHTRYVAMNELKICFAV